MRTLCMLPLVGLLASGPALADQKEADTCLRTKIWSGYDDGWAVRTATTAELAQGEHRIYLVTLYAGNEYKFQVCGDAQASNVDLVLHDQSGKELARDKSDDREPMVTYKPQTTDTYYVAVYAASVAGDAKGPKAGVALAVTYR
jgi:hypothetical protein